MNNIGPEQEQFLAVVSHDFKNPLSAIELDAQLLLRQMEKYPEHPLENKIRQQANRILKTADRMRGLVQDLVEYHRTKLSSHDLFWSKINLNLIIQEVIEIFEPLIRQKGQKINYNSSPEIWMRGDEKRISQLIQNLLANAIKFSPAGSEIRFELNPSEQDILFSIKDQGPGFSLLELDHIFDKFWTKEKEGHQGTGLGLFICREIVKAHEGRIWANNLDEGGAALNIIFPSLELSEKNQRNGHKILLLLQDDDLAELMVWAFAQKGFETVTYRHPEKVLMLLEHDLINPDLIIMNHQLAGISVYNFLDRLRDLKHPDSRECPLLILGPAEPTDDLEDLENKSVRIISKPLVLDNLIQNLESFTLEQ